MKLFRRVVPYLCIILSAALAGSAGAYLISRTETIVNRFRAAVNPQSVDCLISEDVSVTGMKRNVYVTNTGTEDAYIRLSLSVNSVYSDGECINAFINEPPFTIYAAATYTLQNLKCDSGHYYFNPEPGCIQSGLVCGGAPDELSEEWVGWEEQEDDLGSMKNLALYNGYEGYIVLAMLSRSYVADNGTGGNTVFDGYAIGSDMSLETINSGEISDDLRGWVYSDGSFYWTKPVAPGESTEVLFDALYVLGDYDGDEMPETCGEITPHVSFDANAAASSGLPDCFSAFEC